MWFGCSSLCSRQQALVWFSTWWGSRWEERIRPDSILAWFTKSKTCVSCDSVPHWCQGRTQQPTHTWMGTFKGSSEAVKFLKFHGRAAEQREESPGKPSASPGPGAEPGTRPAARAAAAQIYLGSGVFYSQILVTTITFKWLLNGHYSISKQHWNEILIWKLWFLGPSTWIGWCQRPTDRISIP